MPYDNPQESGGGVELPVSIANGGTGSTTAADARTALGLGSAATQSSAAFDAAGAAAAAQAASQPLDADLTAIAALSSAADKLPYATGAQAWSLTTLTTAGRNILDDADNAAQRTTLGLGTVATLASDTDGTLAGNSDSNVPTQKAVKTYVDAHSATTNYASNWHLGVQTYYLTLALAHTAAVNGDTIEIHGILNERLTVGKNITIHCPTSNDGLTYTGTSGSLFSDGGSARTFRITGRGSFQHTGASGTCTVFDISHASSDCRVWATYAYSENGSVCNNQSTGTMIVNIDKASHNNSNWIFLNNGTARANIGEMSHTNNGMSLQCANAGTMIANVGTSSGTYSPALNSGSGEMIVRFGSVTTTSSFSNEFTNSGSGRLSVYVDSCLASAGDIFKVSSGVMEVLGGRYKTGGTNKNGFVLSSTQETRVHGGVCIIANGSGHAFSASTAQSVKLYGDIVVNLQSDADITFQCGSYTIDSNVT